MNMFIVMSLVNSTATSSSFQTFETLDEAEEFASEKAADATYPKSRYVVTQVVCVKKQVREPLTMSGKSFALEREDAFANKPAPLPPQGRR